MKKKNYTIKIENPCHEKWDEMTTNQQGKFCSVCSKNVVDFTGYSDKKLVQYLASSKVSICGRVDNNQLNKVITFKERRDFQPRYSILVAGLTLLISTGVYSQTYINNEVINTEISNSKTNLIKPSVQSTQVSNILRGKVIDSSSNEGLAFVNIYIAGTNYMARTNWEGEFQIIISDYEAMKDIIEVNVRYVGYEDYNMSIQKNNFPVNEMVTIKMNNEEHYDSRGEVVITTRTVHSKITSDSTATNQKAISNILQGKVIDEETKETLPFVNIYIEGTDYNCVTDIEGNFNLVISDYNSLKDTVDLTMSYLGYAPKITKIEKANFPNNEKMVVEMKDSPVMLGGLTIIMGIMIPIEKPSVTNLFHDDDVALPPEEFDYD